MEIIILSVGPPVEVGHKFGQIQPTRRQNFDIYNDPTERA